MGMMRVSLDGVFRGGKIMTNHIVVAVDPDLEPLIPGFLSNRQQDIEDLHTALSAGDFARVQSIGHSLKGVGGGYGFERISDVGADLEAAAKQQDSAAINTLIATLQDYLGRVEVVYQ